jgi:hypothetical protein
MFREVAVSKAIIWYILHALGGSRKRDELIVDIRSFYIFARIPDRIAEASIRRLAREYSKALEEEFYRLFRNDLDWFNHHVTFYRDDFVEHPKTASPL